VPETPNRSRLIAASSIAAWIAAGAGTVALFARERSAQARQEEALKKELDQGRWFRVARVAVAPADRVVSLPAEVRREQHATLYAKVSGYVSKVLVERGDKVRKGRKLAVLESPDLAAQVASAQAELTFRRSSWRALERLASSGRVSIQDHEAAVEGVKVAGAALARAEIQRGSRCCARRSTGPSLPGTPTRARSSPRRPAAPPPRSRSWKWRSSIAFRIALHLGQEDARGSRGDAVQLQASPDQAPFEARISRISQSLDPRTRTMLCEIDLAQPPSGLYPAHSSDEAPGARAAAPAATDRGAARPGRPALRRAGGGREGPLPARSPGVDDGAHVEVLDGLRGGELVALSLGPKCRTERR